MISSTRSRSWVIASFTASFAPGGNRAAFGARGRMSRLRVGRRSQATGQDVTLPHRQDVTRIEAGCHLETRQDVAARLFAHKNIAPLLAQTLPGCRQAACSRLAQRRCKNGSGRRDSNPRQPAWKAGGCKITACLSQTATTGCLTGAPSFSRTHDKSCCMLFSCLLAKVFTLR